jgi:Zn-dependent peptidase ImmA (M78 family)
MAHCLAAAGGGFVWPNAIFASDGDSMEIAAKPKSKGARFEPVRYISDVQAWISADEFEQKVDKYMESVLSRMRSLQLQDRCLPSLWAEILDERRDAELTQHRKLEAMAGFDPDQAPGELIENLLADQDDLGKSAVAEVAAEARHATGIALQIIRDLGRSDSRPKPGGFRARFPQRPTPPVARHEGLPWQKAASLARLARDKWGFANKPIDDRALADLLSAEVAVFSDNSIVASPMPLGLRTGDNGTFDIYFNRRSNTTRRFATSRLLGDYLYFSNQERLLPATHAKTSRQKFQRSFAQEFLCPIDALLAKIQTAQPDEDDISEAADYFQVSPLMVRTTLVNHGQLEREALAWAD